RKLEKLNKI
ncbi:hypothetical protein ACTFIZ_000285, partial [Dictyostelium cf. discoideum]